jgi:hypothetical protein
MWKHHQINKSLKIKTETKNKSRVEWHIYDFLMKIQSLKKIMMCMEFQFSSKEGIKRNPIFLNETFDVKF